MRLNVRLAKIDNDHIMHFARSYSFTQVIVMYNVKM